MSVRAVVNRDTGDIVRYDGLPEQRDPRGATQQLRWTTPDLATLPDWDGDAAFRHAYYANVVAYRCVQIIANALASCPFRAGTKYRSAAFNENAPLARFLGPAPGGPAPNLAARKLWAWTAAQRLVCGRNAWELELTNGSEGDIVAIWPLVSPNLKAVPTTGGNEWFSLFTYGRNDDPKTLQPSQVFYGWDPSGLDFRQPESCLEAARYDLAVAQLCDRYSLAFLKNGAVPAAIVSVAEFPDEATKQRFMRGWNAEYKGAESAGKVVINEVGPGDGTIKDSLDVKVLGLSAKDSKLVEQHREALQMVAIDLGVPWSKLDASGRTFDNAKAEDKTFWEERMLPFLTTFEDEINIELAPRLGSEIGWFDISQIDVLRRNIFAGFESQLPALIDTAVTKNEVRDNFGLPPIDGGDELAAVPEDPAATTAQTARLLSVPETLQKLYLAVGKVITAEEARRIAISLGAPLTEEVPEGLPNVPLDPAAQAGLAEEDGDATPSPAPPARSSLLRAVDHEQRRANLWKANMAAVDALEERWQRSFRRLFAKQEKATLARLNGKRGRQAVRAAEPDPNLLFDPAFWTDETSDLAAELYETVATVAGGAVTAKFGVGFDLENPRVVEFILSRSNQLAGQVTETTYRAITEAMAEGVTQGESIPKLAKRIQGVFEQASRNRAEVIARTEVISAFNGSSVAMAAELPADVAYAQEWIATRDGRTREAHRHADGQVVLVGAAFSVGGEPLAYPGDPAGRAENTIQCRCTVAFLSPEETEAQGGVGRSRVSSRRARAVLSMIQQGATVEPGALRELLSEEAA